MAQEQEYDRARNSKVYYLNFRKKNFKEQNSRSKIDSMANSIRDFVVKNRPNIPVYCLRPHSIKKAAKFFVKNFTNSKYDSSVLYSVKSNSDKIVLKYLFESGVSKFDVASLFEIKLIDELFGKKAKMFFMHPIKSRESIKSAYFDFNIRDFSLDSFDELEKILEVTKNAKDLNLHIRLSIPNSHSAIDLSGKFGILPSEATGLIRKARAVSKKLGICFHVGSQCMDPVEYRNAINTAKEVIRKARVRLDVLDVGGGFPSIYPSMTPLEMHSYFDEIFEAINQADFSNNCEIWCEPGRALVAEAVSLVVRVEARKKNMLYINDGTYGGLFDAGFPGFIYPTQAIRIKNPKTLEGEKTSFGFYGPTCDSMDTMKGPFYLPENISEGDYIEIGQLGAYSRSIRTEFNGFGEVLQIEVSDEPIESMYVSGESNLESSSKKL
jgi:ornithine decarboxylase